MVRSHRSTGRCARIRVYMYASNQVRALMVEKDGGLARGLSVQVRCFCAYTRLCVIVGHVIHLHTCSLQECVNVCV